MENYSVNVLEFDLPSYTSGYQVSEKDHALIRGYNDIVTKHLSVFQFFGTKKLTRVFLRPHAAFDFSGLSDYAKGYQMISKYELVYTDSNLDWLVVFGWLGEMESIYPEPEKLAASRNYFRVVYSEKT
jgi:hypothetical protein